MVCSWERGYVPPYYDIVQSVLRLRGKDYWYRAVGEVMAMVRGGPVLDVKVLKKLSLAY